MSQRQTALGRLLQESREAAGYSRTRLGELVGIKPGTIEGWEIGRVAKPPIHDILRLSHFLDIPADAIQEAVFQDAGLAPRAHEGEALPRRRGRPPRREARETSLLEAAFRLLGWRDEVEASDALGVTPELVRRWRTGQERMTLADYLTLTSIIGVAAAEALKGDEGRSEDLSAAAEALGVRVEAGAE